MLMYSTASSRHGPGRSPDFSTTEVVLAVNRQSAVQSPVLTLYNYTVHACVFSHDRVNSLSVQQILFNFQQIFNYWLFPLIWVWAKFVINCGEYLTVCSVVITICLWPQLLRSVDVCSSPDRLLMTDCQTSCPLPPLNPLPSPEPGKWYLLCGPSSGWTSY